MARYTTAYSSFINRIAEVELLRVLAAKRERQDPVANRFEINALCRGSIVLLCSHLEAYIKQLGEIALEALYIKKVQRERIDYRLFYHISKDLLDQLHDTDDAEKIAKKIFWFVANDVPHWERSGCFPQQIVSERFNKGFSNPGFDKIAAYFGRFGYENYKRDLAVQLKSRFKPTVVMVDHLVDIRNKIAHGDAIALKTPLDIKEMVDIVKYYCRATDDLFAKWFAVDMCAIR